MTEQSIRDRIISRNTASADKSAAPAHASNDVRDPRRSWIRVLGFSALGLILVAGVTLGAMQIPAVGNLVSRQLTPANAAADPKLPDTPFLEHAKKAGVQACGSVFPVLGQLLAAGASYEVQSDWNSAEPDKHAIRSLVGMTIASPNYSGPAAGVVFAAPGISGCEGTMVRVVPFQQSCEMVASKLPSKSIRRPNLAQIAVFDLADNVGQVLLLPSAQSCVAISIGLAAKK